MGCDIHTAAERKEGGAWKVIPGLEPFDWRSYGLFGFLANVRNWSAVTPISEPRGIPKDSVFFEDEWQGDAWVGEHSHSWLSLDELLAFDYDAPIEDRRVTIKGNGGCTCEAGQGEMTTYREFLGPAFFEELEKLKASGAERIVFGFDS